MTHDSTSGPVPLQTVNAIKTWFGPVVTAGGQNGGQTVSRSRPEAQAAIAALEKLGIRIPR